MAQNSLRKNLIAVLERFAFHNQNLSKSANTSGLHQSPGSQQMNHGQDVDAHPEVNSMGGISTAISQQWEKVVEKARAAAQLLLKNKHKFGLTMFSEQQYNATKLKNRVKPDVPRSRPAMRIDGLKPEDDLKLKPRPPGT